MNISSVVVVILLLLLGAYMYSKENILPKKHLVIKPHDKCPVSFTGDRLKPCSVQDDCNACDVSLCTTVTDEKPYRYTRAGEVLKIPNGKWCLPPKATEIKCTKTTGERVLTYDRVLKNYVWRCRCKDPNNVRNAGLFGDCTEVVACNGGELVCPEGSDQCTAGEKWDETKTWSPEIGVCKCSQGKKYVVHNGRKLCEIDGCFPGHTDGEKGCICPRASKVKDGWSSTISFNGKCIPDPCNPSGYSEGGRCVCNKGGIPYQDSLSPTGWICKTPCDPETNPCGKRGRCTFDATGKVRCEDCRYPNYQSDDGLCNNIVKSGNVRCEHSYECETRACDKTLAPIWKIGDGHKYCSPY